MTVSDNIYMILADMRIRKQFKNMYDLALSSAYLEPIEEDTNSYKDEYCEGIVLPSKVELYV